MLTKQDLTDPAWCNRIFSQPPARIVKGRNKWKHRHAAWIHQLNRLVYTESRNELVTLLVLEHLHNLGQIKRFKEQPFTLAPQDFSKEYTPDFFFEGLNNDKYAVEVKTQRFLTRTIEDQLNDIEEQLNEQGVQFLLWTDQSALSHQLRHNIINMRRTSIENFADEEKAALMDRLASKKSTTMGELLSCDIDLNLIMASLYMGVVHADIRQRLTFNSAISNQPIVSLKSSLVKSTASHDDWWDSLRAA